MPIVPWDRSVPENYLAPVAPMPEGSGWAAAFRQENAPLAAFDLITRPRFTPDPTFDPLTLIKETPELMDDPGEFLFIDSKEEFEHKLEKRRQEIRDRQLLAANGWAGFGQMMLAGLLSPTILIPGGAIAKTARGVSIGRTALSGGVWAMAGTSIDEGILYLAQEERTGSEALLGISTAGVLGSVIGGAAGLLTRRQIARFEENMALGASPDAIQTYGGGNLSAAKTPEELLELEDAGKVYLFDSNAKGSFLSPVMRNLNQRFSPTLRRFQAKLNTAGLYLTGNKEGIASSSGGEVASLAKLHYSKLYDVKRGERDIFARYWRETPKAEQLNRKEFYKAVGRSLSGGTEENPFVTEMAALYRKQFFDPMFEEARAVGIPGFDKVSDEFRAKYMPRVWRMGMMESERLALVDMLTEHFSGSLSAMVRKKFARIDELSKADEEVIELLSLTPDARIAKAKDLEAALEELPQNYLDVAGLVKGLREDAAAVAGKKGPEADAMRASIKQRKKDNKAALADYNKAERGLKRRLKLLTKTAAGFEEAQRKVLNRIEALEEQQLVTVDGAMKAAVRLQEKLRKGETKLDADVERLADRLKKAFETMARAELRLDKMRELPEGFEHLVLSDPRPTDKISTLESRQAAREQALNDLLAQIEDLRNAQSRGDISRLVEEQLNNVRQATVRVVSKRAARLEKMYEKAQQLDATQNTKIRSELEARVQRRRLEFMSEMSERYNVTGRIDPTGKRFLAEAGADPLTNIDVTEAAREIASDVSARMMGDNKKITAVGQLSERGSELARTLDIDPFRVMSNGRTFGEFLEWDVEKVSRYYTRQIGIDIELQRAFGSVNPLAKDSPLMKQIAREFNTELDKIKADQTLDEKQKAKSVERLNSEYRQALTDIDIQIQRLRYVRGMPENPEAITYRAGRLAMNMNVLRFMGGVVSSSLPDLGSVVARSGMRVFSDGLLPMMQDFKTFKMSTDEGKYAAVTLDLELHSRMAALYDIFDEVEHGTAFERGVQGMTNKFGLYTGIDAYNTGMKSFSTAMVNARMMTSLKAVVTGKPKKMDVAYLAANGIDAVDAGRMWQQITQTPGGGDKVNGVWLPNTIDWADADLARAYRAAVNRQVESMIVTPGTERPNIMDANMLSRIVFQFRAFQYSSTQRYIMASAQEAALGNTAPVFAGVMTSLGMGAVSYAVWGIANQVPLSDDINVWINEAVNRSGILGVLAEVKNVGEEFGWTRDIATLGASRSTKTSRFSDPASRVLGPTFGFLANDVPTIVSNPTSQAGENAIVRMLPYQNFTLMAWMFDAIQANVGNQ